MNIESEYALQMMMLGGSGASRFNYTLRNIISFDGINQYGTLATPWAPGGQGRITLHVKVTDSAAERYLFDGEDSGLNRLFAYIDSTDNVITSAGLTADVDASGIAFAADSTVQQVIITGDMTGLTVGRIISKYDSTAFSAGNILYAKFEDLSTPIAGTNDLEYEFTSGTSTESPVNEGASNLITYQNYSADQWATYIQQPNGDWLNKETPFDTIALSTYMQNQFYIDQTEAAITGYKAQNISRYITDSDGVDDELVLATIPSPAGVCAVSFRVELLSESSPNDIIRIGNMLLLNVPVANSLRLYPDVVTSSTSDAQVMVSTKLPINEVYEIKITATHGSVNAVVTINGADIDLVLPLPASIPELPIRFAYADFNRSDMYCYDVSYTDHESPLPIGHGGNSGFWPLDDADDIARNILGLDGNGNVIARTGATTNGFGAWDGSPSRELFSLDVATGSLVSDTTTLTLSAELQRLYDLSVVEAKIAKLDAQFARVQPLLSPDGVDDYGLFSAWTAAGAFTAETMFATSSAGDMGIMWSAADQYARLLAGDLRVLNTVTSLDSGVNSADGTLHTFRLEYDGTNSFIYIDDVFVSTIAGLAIPNVISRLWYYQSGLFSGYGSYLKLIDYADPSNSRFYMPTATGLADLLGTGATDGTYNGSPAAPELFYRVGDNWQNADASTIIPGA